MSDAYIGGIAVISEYEVNSFYYVRTVDIENHLATSTQRVRQSIGFQYRNFL